MTQQARPAMLVRSSGVSFGVIAMNAGTVAIGSTITNERADGQQHVFGKRHAMQGASTASVMP